MRESPNKAWTKAYMCFKLEKSERKPESLVSFEKDWRNIREKRQTAYFQLFSPLISKKAREILDEGFPFTIYGFLIPFYEQTCEKLQSNAFKIDEKNRRNLRGNS